MDATNRSNALDTALRKFQRFDREIDKGIPNETGRLGILRIPMKNMKKAEDVDLQKLAHVTHNYVGGDLAQLAAEDGLQCLREKIKVIDIEDKTIDALILDSMAVTNGHFLISFG